MNDELFVRNATPSDAQSVYSIQMPAPTFSSMPTFFKEQKEMVQASSIQPGMSLQWYQKYRHDNHWDYTTAAQVLSLPKAKYKMPEGALPQSDP